LRYLWRGLSSLRVQGDFQSPVRRHSIHLLRIMPKVMGARKKLAELRKAGWSLAVTNADDLRVHRKGAAL
jgi:hypothetical protein